MDDGLAPAGGFVERGVVEKPARDRADSVAMALEGATVNQCVYGVARVRSSSITAEPTNPLPPVTMTRLAWRDRLEV
jgi:hypothetical protein